VSTRGLGSVKPLGEGVVEVQDDYRICAIDVVCDPSADAYFTSLMEEHINNPQVVWHNFCAKSSRGKDERTKEKLGDIAILLRRIEELETELKKSHARIDTLEWELAGSKQPSDDPHD
jgi:hypothetical protein